MGYRIQYTPEFNKRYAPKAGHKRNFMPLLVVSAVLIALYIGVQTNIIGSILPGDKAITATAFSELVQSVESGVSVRESLLLFCREVIVNGV